MNDELEALRHAREAFSTPPSMTPQQVENVRVSDLVSYASRLPEPPTPRDLLEQRMPMESKTLMDVEGLALPSQAADIRVDEMGSYPVDAQGNRLEWMRVSPVLPVATNKEETRLAMPYLLQMAGNTMGGIFQPVRGAGMIAGAGPIRRAAEAFPRQLNELGLYSAATDVLAGLKQEKMSGQDIVNYLKSKAPTDELRATGFEDWATSRPQVTKQEAMDYLKSQQPEIQEVVLGGQPKGGFKFYEESEDGLYSLIEDASSNRAAYDRVRQKHPELPSFDSFPNEAERADAISGNFVEYFDDFIRSSANRPVVYDNTEEGLSNLAADAARDRNLYERIRQTSPDMPRFEDFPDEASRIDSMLSENPDPLMYFINSSADAANLPPGWRPSKYADKVIPGGENYREVVLSVPDPTGALRKISQKYDPKIEELNNQIKQASDEMLRIYADPAGSGNDFMRAKDNVRDLTAELRSLNFAKETEKINVQRSANFKSSHWDEPNVLAHLRMSDREIDGRKVLHIEELQSDWAQQGRMRGFKQTEDQISSMEKKADSLRQELIKYYESLPDRHRPTPDEIQKDISRMANNQLPFFINVEGPAGNLVSEFIDSYSKLRKAQSAIAQGPYVTDTAKWTQLALKRALREAAQGGYDEMIITPGSEQFKRWGNKGLVHYYDNVVPSQLKKLVKEIDPKADVKIKEVNVPISKSSSSDEFNDLYTNQRGEEFLRNLDESSDGYYSDFVADLLSSGRPIDEIIYEEGLVEEFLEWAARFATDKNAANTIKMPVLELSPEIREKILTQGFKTFRDGGVVAESSKKREMLIDKYPTKYLPKVGRQVMAEGGIIDKALKLASKFGSSPRDTVKSIKRHRGRSVNS